MKEYTVWVGGVEINDHYLTKHKAKIVADEWRAKGYDDVVIQTVSIYEQANNMTVEDILYTYELIEQAIRCKVSNYINANGTEKDRELVVPFDCAIEHRGYCGLSGLEHPWIKELKEMIGEGIITVVMEDNSELDLDCMDIDSQMSILKNL